MIELLAELSSVTGVSRIFAFHNKNGILAKLRDLDFTDEQLQTVGNYFLRMFGAGQLAGLLVNSAHMQFNDYVLLGISFAADTVVIFCCEPEVDTAPIVLSAAETIIAHRPSPVTDTTEGSEDQIEESAILEELDEGEIEILPFDDDDENMQQYYDSVEKLLAMSIGPMADLVMRESLKIWRQNGPAIPARIYELVAIMAKEIGDTELAEEFIARSKQIF